MHEAQSHISGEELNPAVDLPNTFGGLEKQWSILDKRQKVAALGNLWEGKKRIKGPNGDEYGLTEKEFVRMASIIIGEEREAIESLFSIFLQRQPDDLANTPVSDFQPEKKYRKPNEKTKRIQASNGEIKKSSGSRGRPRKKPDEPKPIILTPEQIREVNKRFAQKDRQKILAQLKNR